jgi:hypothetical protein
MKSYFIRLFSFSAALAEYSFRPNIRPIIFGRSLVAAHQNVYVFYGNYPRPSNLTLGTWLRFWRRMDSIMADYRIE